ncbi:MAG: 1-acyl-sn-glycerol-3-phosphate acyltransferase, partial [Actinomycetota bacterium]|nr:1-acyl-sn-glycerol-3-phosphate acyltransferase [Actinomycetota bacterium]
DVLLVAHTGMDHVLTIRDVWDSLPMDKQIIMRWWRVPREEIPTGREEQIVWLFDRWEQIDSWIAANRPADLPAVRLFRPSGRASH